MEQEVLGVSEVRKDVKAVRQIQQCEALTTKHPTDLENHAVIVVKIINGNTLVSRTVLMFLLKNYLFIYRVFLGGCNGSSLVHVDFSSCSEQGFSVLQCAGLSLQRILLEGSTGSRAWASVAAARGLSCPVARGIFLDQGSNQRPLHWQADSQP